MTVATSRSQRLLADVGGVVINRAAISASVRLPPSGSPLPRDRRRPAPRRAPGPRGSSEAASSAAGPSPQRVRRGRAAQSSAWNAAAARNSASSFAASAPAEPARRAARGTGRGRHSGSRKPLRPALAPPSTASRTISALGVLAVGRRRNFRCRPGGTRAGAALGAARLKAEGRAVIAIARFGRSAFGCALEIEPRGRDGQVGPQAQLLAGEIGEDIGAVAQTPRRSGRGRCRPAG